VKRVVLFIIAAPVLLFVVQNIQVAELRFLIWRIAMPQALLIMLIFVSGILIGWLLRAVFADSTGQARGE